MMKSPLKVLEDPLKGDENGFKEHVEWRLRPHRPGSGQCAGGAQEILLPGHLEPYFLIIRRL